MLIDLNADIGEGYPFDLALIPLISSANISCGAHAGSVAQIQQAIAACKEQQVAIGAHPSYPDRVNFGRIEMPFNSQELKEILHLQLNWFAKEAQALGAAVCHVKTHGALYNQSAVDAAVAKVVAEVCKAHFPTAALVTLPHSIQAKIAQDAGLRVKVEAFADRGYLANGCLVPRNQAGALLSVTEAIRQVMCIVQHQRLQCQDGQSLAINADTICLHGDSKEALQLAQELNQQLKFAGITIKKLGVTQ
jgi:UPF0271 protein